MLVVGGGHNGLICAAYLARAGVDVLLVEARPTVGGCASTVSDLGARFNICHCDHTMIRAVPVLDELELDQHGLRYLEPDAGGVYLFHDRSAPWALFNDVEQTLDGLAVAYPGEVAGYRRYLADALPAARLAIEIAGTTPSAGRMLGVALRSGGRRGAAARRLLAWGRSSLEEVLGGYFEAWQLRMPATATGPTVWGVPPDTSGTGLAALGYATRHLVKTGRPAGGSGALTDAIRSALEAAGGTVRCGAPVRSLRIADGAVTGVELVDGSVLEASTIVAACDPRRVLLDWVGTPPPAARRLVRRLTAVPDADGYESKVDAVLSNGLQLIDVDQLEDRHCGVDLSTPSTVIAPTPGDLAEAHRLRPLGRVAERPTLLVNVPSVLDPSMAPRPGAHVLSLETLFTPYALDGGWPASTEPRRWLELLASFATPGFAESVERWRAMTPDRYEREFSMHRGHTPAYAGSPLATLIGRHREVSRYRTPIGGLYLSGAGTFPGAGIVGASGRHAASAVLDDLRHPVHRRLRTLAPRRRAATVVGRAADLTADLTARGR